MEGLIERGHSSWYWWDGVFCLSLAGVFALAQGLVALLEIAEVDVPG